MDGVKRPLLLCPVCATPRSPRRGSLGPREVRFLGLLRKGLSNKQIGGIMGLSKTSVGGLSSKVFRKLGVHNRVAAAIWAGKHCDLLAGLKPVPYEFPIGVA